MYVYRAGTDRPQPYLLPQERHLATLHEGVLDGIEACFVSLWYSDECQDRQHQVQEP